MNFLNKEIAASCRTPFYCYDMSLLRSTLKAAKEAAGDAHIHYAIKANAEVEILRLMAQEGFGADCVSQGEIREALAAGFPAESIVFAGVGKSDEEIEYAVAQQIGMLNVESVEELRVISEIASRMGSTATVALRINPDIDAHTHHFINTGVEESKFGISLPSVPAIASEAATLPGIKIVGLHFHIGSQVLTMEPYRQLGERINSIYDIFTSHGFDITSINVGGGLGIDYDDPQANPIPDFAGFFAAVRENLKLRPGQTLHCELGRSLVAQCGALISKVLYVKEGVGKRFAIIDAGMTELIRPALYGALHKVVNISNPDGVAETYDVVGPICESSDTFAEGLSLPAVKRGDYVAILSAGAYGRSMASTYNCRPLPQAVFI